jgi:hypothetical protein
MPEITYQDHQARAANRLLSQFRKPQAAFALDTGDGTALDTGDGSALATQPVSGGTLLQAMVRALLQPSDELEDAFLALLNERHIDNAVGKELDIIGDLAEGPRQGRTDADYRVALKARIAINTSKATPPDVKRVADLITPDGASVRYFEPLPATISIDVAGYNLTKADVRTLNNARPGGVRLEAASTSVTPFAWEAPPGKPQTGGHFANGSDTSGAGAFVSIRTGD